MDYPQNSMKTVTDFIFLGSKITAESDCSHEIKRCLLLGRKALTNLDSVLKSRHYFADKGPSSPTMVFPVVMYGCESWTIKKVERQRIDVFELWYWRKLLRAPWKQGDKRDDGFIRELGRSSAGGPGNPFQYSCLKNPMDRGAWRAMVGP